MKGPSVSLGQAPVIVVRQQSQQKVHQQLRGKVKGMQTKGKVKGMQLRGKVNGTQFKGRSR